MTGEYGLFRLRGREYLVMNMPEELLRQGIDDLGIAVDAGTSEKLLAFVGLLSKWNRVYNLTSVRKAEDIVIRHILDSLAVVPYLQGSRILDVGTGAGLPGIPLAIACPRKSFVLLDSSNKKLRFVRQAVAELGVNNIVVEHVRVEDYRPEMRFDTVVCRAFSALQDLCAPAAHLCPTPGHVLAMKGVYPVAEIEALKDHSVVEEVVSLDVPGLDAVRHLVVLRTPDVAVRQTGTAQA
jgi:16S rRNA (guanine527-N7)-methyltransferase